MFLILPRHWLVVKVFFRNIIKNIVPIGINAIVIFARFHRFDPHHLVVCVDFVEFFALDFVVAVHRFLLSVVCFLLPYYTTIGKFVKPSTPYFRFYLESFFDRRKSLLPKDLRWPGQPRPP